MPDPEPRSHPCPACGFRVHDAGPGTGGTCPLCGWVDDLAQLAQPDFAIGANSPNCLRSVQRRALERFPLTVREAGGGFRRDERWRPLAPGEGWREAAFGSSSPVCSLESDADLDAEPYWLTPPPE